MSTLREAAQAALEHWDKVSGIFRMTTETNRLRAALAQPETAEPVAWQRRYAASGHPPSDWLPCLPEDVEHYSSRSYCEVRPLYAHPPRDEWRPASEPPTGGMRRVLVWHKQGGFNGTWYSPGHWDEHWPLGTITHWRDVQPPTEGSE